MDKNCASKKIAAQRTSMLLHTFYHRDVHYWLVGWCSLLLYLFVGATTTLANPPQALPIPPTSSEVKNQPRILLLQSYGYAGRPVVQLYVQSLISTLSLNGVPAENIMVEYLNLGRNPDQKFIDLKRQTLLHQYRNEKIDLILALQQPALNFFLTELKELAPQAPILAIHASLPDGASLGAHHLWSQVAAPDIRGTINHALELFPDTQHIFVPVGTDVQDQALKRVIQTVAAIWQGKLTFEYSDGLTFAQTQERIAHLPAQTVVLPAPLSRDSNGHTMLAHDAAIQLTKIANAPVFALYDYHVGKGAIGGSIIDTIYAAEISAKTILDIYSGKLPLGDRVSVQATQGVPVFDWQQIQRWGGKSERLPKNAKILNQPSNLLSDHPWLVVSTALAFLVLTSLIIMLLIQNQRRKLAEDLLQKHQETLEEQVRTRTIELQERESQLSAVMGSTNDMIWSVDTQNFSLTSFNQSLSTFVSHGATQQVKLGMRPEEVLPRNATEAWIGYYQRLLSQGPFRIEHQTSFGGKTLELSFHRIERDNKTIGISIFARDITELKRSQAALQNSEQRFRAMIDQAPMAIGIACNLKYTYVNPAWLVMYGYDSPDEALGHSIAELIAPSARAAFLERAKTRIQGQPAPATYETLALRKDGSEFSIQITAAYIQRMDGADHIAFGIDITERKRQEAMLKAAKDAAESSIRTKSTFLANMSHEIRTPMNAILGLTGLALRTELTPKQSDYLRKIKLSADSLLGIISDILDFSKIEAGKFTMEMRSFSLTEALEKVETLIEHKAHEKGLTLIFKTATDIPDMLIGDQHRLVQVLGNLCSNAVKFTANGDIVVSTMLDCPATASAGHLTLRFSVSDQGIGIASKNITRLFQPFTQADTSTTRQYGGTGLGLAISKELVHLMRGEIGVDSELGKGSTFYFTACFDRGSANTARSADESSTKNNASDINDVLQHIRGLRILLAEDNNFNQQVAQELLTSMANTQLTIVENGQEALDILNKNEFDLVLMDIQMPVMDGYETTRRIRQRTIWKDLPIIAMTAHAMTSDRNQCLAVGMNDYISKPFDPMELFAVLAKWARP